MDIFVKDSVFDPAGSNDRQILFYKEGDNKFVYKVWVYLSGAQLYYVDHVIYSFPSIFKNNEQKVDRTPTNPNCSLSFWTYSIFTVKVKLFLKTGEIATSNHHLTYGQQLTSKLEGVTYVDTKGIK